MGAPRELVETFYRYFADGKMDDAMALFDPSCRTRMPSGEMDQDGHRAMGDAFKAAFPDSRMVIDMAVEEGDAIVVIGDFRGTHTGDLQSPDGTIPASGNALDLRFFDYFKVRGDRFVEHQTVFDQMQLLGQVGALPPS
jgi:predicted ester cyclase